MAAAWPMLIAQTKSELLQLLRDPAFNISSVTLPTIFLAFFGLPVVGARTAGTAAGDYLLTSFGAYGVIRMMLFSFGGGRGRARQENGRADAGHATEASDSSLRKEPSPPSSSLPPRSWSSSPLGGSWAASSRGWPPG